MICDFCNAKDPKWAYPCKDFDAWEVYGIGGTSVGLWAACNTCHDLIEADNRVGLNQHSITQFEADNPDILIDGAASKMLEEIHAKFFDNRLGLATRIEETA